MLVRYFLKCTFLEWSENQMFCGIWGSSSMQNKTSELLCTLHFRKLYFYGKLRVINYYFSSFIFKKSIFLMIILKNGDIFFFQHAIGYTVNDHKFWRPNQTIKKIIGAQQITRLMASFVGTQYWWACKTSERNFSQVNKVPFLYPSFVSYMNLIFIFHLLAKKP